MDYKHLIFKNDIALHLSVHRPYVIMEPDAKTQNRTGSVETIAQCILFIKSSHNVLPMSFQLKSKTILNIKTSFLHHYNVYLFMKAQSVYLVVRTFKITHTSESSPRPNHHLANVPHLCTFSVLLPTALQSQSHYYWIIPLSFHSFNTYAGSLTLDQIKY